MLSYNDCDEIRELYNGFSMFDFSRTHSMAQRYEREKLKPKQLTIFELQNDDENFDYEKILKEYIIQC